MAENALQEAAEKALVDLVKVRQMEVERLERELDALRAHYSYLFKSFSVPTFPCGISPHNLIISCVLVNVVVKISMVFVLLTGILSCVVH